MVISKLRCAEFVELVTDYLEGALSSADHARFEAHLAVCTGCANYLEQMRQTIRLTGALTEQTIPPTARDHFLDLFRDWKRESP
ncbi:MAG: zf-HC2 domain-containing protein [Chloroflexota bacterium]